VIRVLLIDSETIANLIEGQIKNKGL